MSKRKGLLKIGIDKLEKIMLENAEKYDQRTFDYYTECGTTMCAAGFARLINTGENKFNRELKLNWAISQERCIKDGKEFLGINSEYYLPPIFDIPETWPSKLRDRFNNYKTNKSKVKLYIKILREYTLVNGVISEEKI